MRIRFTIPKPRRTELLLGCSSGFSLLIALSLMSFVVLLVLSLSTLLRISVTEQNANLQLFQAHANARLGALEALGRLQRVAGPDQRVTAPASSFDDSAAGKVQWTGVWNSDVDAASGGVGGAYGDLIQWMVSDGENTIRDAQDVSFDQSQLSMSSRRDWALLVGDGSVSPEPGEAAVREYVAAPLVEVPSYGPTGTSSLGKYAWWVGDEGGKASIQLAEKSEASEISESKRRPTSVSERHALEMMEGFGTVNPGEFEKAGSRSDLGFIVDNPSTIDVKEYFHDVTPMATGLLTDVRRGGLKRDLSLAFALDDSIFNESEFSKGAGSVSPPGVSHDVNFVFTDSVGGGVLRGPTWHLLRDYHNLYMAFDSSWPGNSVPILEDPLGNPTLNARTVFPNSPQLGGYNKNISTVFSNVNVKDDPATNDTIQKGSNNLPTPRAVKGAYTSYCNRILLVFSLLSSKSTIDPGKYEIRLIMTPVVVLHNPYSVFLKQGRTKLSFDGVPVRFIVDTDDGQKIDGHFSEWGPTTEASGFIRFYVPPAILEPGELRVYSPNLSAPVSVERDIEAEPNLYVTGGYELNMPSLTVDATERVRMNMIFEHFREGTRSIHSLKVDQFMNVWPGDDVDHPSIARSSHHSEYDAELSIFSSPDVKEYTGINDLTKSDFFDPVNLLDTPYPLFSLDFSLKAADSGDEYGFTPFVMGNPVAQTSNWEALGDQGDRGYYSTIPIWKPTLANVNGWNSVISVDGNDPYAFWGPSNAASGTTHTSALSIPSAPLQSLAQLQHANLAVQGHLPALAVGNSFATPYVDSRGKYNTSSGRSLYDLSYYMNEALWDRYYFSTIGPRISEGDSDWETPLDAEDLVGDLISGERELPNERLSLIQSSGDSVAELKEHLMDFRSAAGRLAVRGSFNVNSTSVDAWRAILKGAGNSEVAIFDEDGNWSLPGSDSEESRFNRLFAPNGEDLDGSAYSKNAWQGSAILTDDQIDNLAIAIVQEIRGRFSARGDKPFLSLGGFVNRELSDDQYGLAGVLQAAINQVNLNDAFGDSDFTISESVWSNPDIGSFPFPENAASGIHAASSASANFLQADILQRIGPFIQVRSDTFVIRSYGEVLDPVSGESVAQAWCELTVQRIPDPIYPGADTTDPDSYLNPDPSISAFGRKFLVTDFRWLSEDEV